MDKCDFCLCKKDCIGPVIGIGGQCLGFAVPREQQGAYEEFLARQAKQDFAALCRGD